MPSEASLNNVVFTNTNVDNRNLGEFFAYNEQQESKRQLQTKSK